MIHATTILTRTGWGRGLETRGVRERAVPAHSFSRIGKLIVGVFTAFS